jgi:hypothetical protein
MNKLKVNTAGVVTVVIVGLIGGLIYLSNSINNYKKDIDSYKAKLKTYDDLTQIKIDSIKTQYFLDSLTYTDSINKYKILANANLIINIKKDRDEVIGRISGADNNERDQLWATYSPKN